MKTMRIVASAKGCDLAEGLLNGGEVGLLHLTAISHVVGRKIRIWDSSGQILGIFGNQKTHKDVNYFAKYSLEQNKDILEKDHGNVQIGIFNNGSHDLKPDYFFKSSDTNNIYKNGYVELQYQSFDDGRVGHWVSKDSKDFSIKVNSSLTRGNNCLFVAICQQCRDFDPEMLRTLTAEAIRRKKLVIEDVFPQFQGAGILLLGGAKYEGRSSNHAKQILDASQGTVGHRHAAQAHPRGHASHPSATGRIDCVENYSMGATKDFPKSAWLSRDEQDYAIHRLLLTDQVQNGINRLNNGQTRIVLQISPGFEILLGLWADGVMFRGPLRAEFVTILLQHHNGKHNDPNADVQVFTCYPMAPKGSENQSIEIPRNTSFKRPLTPPEDDEEEPNKKSRTDLSL